MECRKCFDGACSVIQVQFTSSKLALALFLDLQKDGGSPIMCEQGTGDYRVCNDPGAAHV